MQFRRIAVLFVCSIFGCAARGGETDDIAGLQGEGAPSLTTANNPDQGSSGSIAGVTLARSGNDFLLSWTTAGSVDTVRVFTGTDPDDLEDLSAKVKGADNTTITGLDPGLRHYFRVEGGHGDGVVVGERGLPQANVVNLRDIGGYTALVDEDDDEDGQGSVAWGKFFRSGFIQPSANQAFLATLGIRTVIDTRNAIEVASGGPQSVPGATIIHRPIYDQNAVGFDPVTPYLCFPGNQTPACYAAQEAHFGPNGEFFHAFKQAGLRALVSGNGPPGANFGQTAKDAVHTLLVTLADEQNIPLVWADSGGDARTGWGSAVVELILGVPEEQVIADYALSSQFRQALITAQLNALVGSGLLAKAVYLEPQLYAYPEYMEAALDEMHTVYGSVTDYAHALGVTDQQIHKIRGHLLRD
jgi:protein-tyrosine phosphatase